METSAVLDRIGELIAQLKGYASKLPPVVHLASVPTGVKPKPEAVEVFEQALLRFREQSGRSPFKSLQDYLIESLEAFEVGNVLGVVQPLLAVLDQVERMHRDREIKVGPAEEKRMGSIARRWLRSCRAVSRSWRAQDGACDARSGHVH